jgi:hypothetical protein
VTHLLSYVRLAHDAFSTGQFRVLQLGSFAQAVFSAGRQKFGPSQGTVIVRLFRQLK